MIFRNIDNSFIQCIIANMNFVFVDETGDLGTNSSYFGLALLHVQDKNYRDIVQLISQIRWLNSIFGEIKKLDIKQELIVMLLKGLNTLANQNHIAASGIMIDKSKYGGRYVNWIEDEYPQTEWPYHLRNYLLRHLLEFHFARPGINWQEIDLIYDRITLTAAQIKNTHNYLNSMTTVPLKETFKIPAIAHFTLVDNTYVCGLEIAHLLTKAMHRQIYSFTPEFFEMTQFLNVVGFIGHQKKPESL